MNHPQYDTSEETAFYVERWVSKAHNPPDSGFPHWVPNMREEEVKGFQIPTCLVLGDYPTQGGLRSGGI